jgi:hypothetical protein
MAEVQKPDLDETTLQIAKRILSMPPKPHSAMKIGKRKAKESAEGESTRKGWGSER